MQVNAISNQNFNATISGGLIGRKAKRLGISKESIAELKKLAQEYFPGKYDEVVFHAPELKILEDGGVEREGSILAYANGKLKQKYFIIPGFMDKDIMSLYRSNLTKLSQEMKK